MEAGIHTSRQPEAPARGPALVPEPLWQPGEPHASDNLRGHFARVVVRLLLLVSADVGAVLLGRLLLRSLRGGVLGGALSSFTNTSFPEAAVSGPQLAIAVVLGLLATDSYRGDHHWKDPARTLSGVALAVLLVFYRDLWETPWVIVLGRAVVVWVLLGLTISLVRLALATLERRVPRAPMAHRVLEIRGKGSLAGGPELGGGFRVVATLRDEDLPDDIEAVEKWLEGGVDTILVSGQIEGYRFGQLTDFALAQGCRLLTVPRSVELVGVDPKRLWLAGRPFFELTAPGLRASHLLLKRIVDVVGSLVLIMVFGPVMAGLAILVKLDSPGPVLFRQRRAGLRGRFFGLLKFRSMRADAEELLRSDPAMHRRHVENDFKLPVQEDPRITRAGRFLRKSSLDELPQLFNVLKGDMSLVGPRPVVEPELAMYSGRISMLLSMKPGITGFWQVSGRSRVAFPERAEMDLEYVRTWSLFGDLWILAMTIPAVLIRRGAH